MGFTHSVIKHLKAKILSDGGPWEKHSSQIWVCGLICVSLGVHDVKKFENHFAKGREDAVWLSGY